MPFRIMFFVLFLFSSVVFAFAQDRKPAVEDFVGIDIEESKVTPYGDESLFNLEQDVGKIQFSKKNKTPVRSDISRKKIIDPITFFGISFALGLPFMVWFMMMSHLRKKAHFDNASNIEILEKYRKTRENKTGENIKKAS